MSIGATTEQIAAVCHEVNRAYCECVGDHSQPLWKDAPKWQKDSAISGVEYQINTHATPEEMHKQWMKEKLADGWVWGPEKDPVKKEHPCLLDYRQLPIQQRIKDNLFRAVVQAMIRD